MYLGNLQSKTKFRDRNFVQNNVGKSLCVADPNNVVRNKNISNTNKAHNYLGERDMGTR